ncbi:MAG: ShlB/FhaC/HecB family hemolysin secretion/activation protein, partial [Proteobacteria bacterium]|nr:ShlB/FhaC/HecB family hemolysin secretion/activation protein [Pseudomonadota bacterium]
PMGFSFSPGVGEDGKSELSVIRFSQDWIKRSPYDVFAARSSFNFGLDAFDSTINEDLPDSKFFTWLGQFQYVRRLNFDVLKFDRLKRSQIIFRTDFQWAEEDLLPLEKLSIGGSTTVRGYRENLLTRDNGMISSLEWRIPVHNLRIKGISKTPEDGEIYLAPFIDYGSSWNTDVITPEPRSISSVGLGLRWNPNRAINAQVYWGHALRNIEEPDEKNLQDDGIHFELSLRVPF